MSKIENFCRICLKVKTDLCSIYSYKKNEFLPSVIYNISGVQIARRTEPHAQICARCAAAALVAQTIILRCQESEQRLQAQQTQRIDTSEQDRQEQADCEQHEQLEILEEDCEIYDALLVEMPASEMSLSQDYMLTAELEEACVVNQQPVRTTAQNRSTLKQSIFSCEHCDYNTKTGRRLIEHKRDVHKIYDPNIYECTLCPQRFSWKPTLYRHIQLDHKTLPEDKKYLCNECGCAYTREVHLMEHIKQRHGPRRYKCPDPECHQSFTRTFTLRRHYQSSHADSRGENFDKIAGKRATKRRLKEHL